MAADVAMNDMDIDFDMDGDMDPEIARLQAEAEAINARAQAEDSEAMNGVEEMPEEGEVHSNTIASNKVHVRGLDKLNTYDIEQWVEAQYSMDLFKKVQWIDDSSANLIFDTETAAAEALPALSAEEVLDPLQLRAAKRIAANHDSELLVRQAIVADVKAPGAKTRSAYYLFNKQWDPDNPDNIRPDNRKRRWVDDERRDNKSRRRDYESDRQPRRGSGDPGPQFHEDMYGDDPKAGDNSSRRNSQSSGSEIARRKMTSNQDLFATKSNGRLRNRSASPVRDEDGRYGFDDDQPRRRTARARSPPPSNIRGGRDNRGSRDNLRKELFPTKRPSTALTNGRTKDIEMVSRYERASENPSRELFPDKPNGKLHRRQSAKELTANEVADAIGKYTFDGANEYSAYSRPGRRPANGGDRGEGKDLFSRISGGPKVESTYGRLRDREEDDGFSIKGAGRVDGTQGFSIRGASREQAQNPLVKELFPLKASSGNGGGGKDLFDGRIKGRGTQRRRAEDLF